MIRIIAIDQVIFEQWASILSRVDAIIVSKYRYFHLFIERSDD